MIMETAHRHRFVCATSMSHAPITIWKYLFHKKYGWRSTKNWSSKSKPYINSITEKIMQKKNIYIYNSRSIRVVSTLHFVHIIFIQRHNNFLQPKFLFLIRGSIDDHTWRCQIYNNPCVLFFCIVNWLTEPCRRTRARDVASLQRLQSRRN